MEEAVELGREGPARVGFHMFHSSGNVVSKLILVGHITGLQKHLCERIDLRQGEIKIEFLSNVHHFDFVGSLKRERGGLLRGVKPAFG